MGDERQSLIDLELARTEFRLDVLKLRKQLAQIGVGRDPDKPAPPPVAVVTTLEGTSVEPAGDARPTPSEPATTPRAVTAGSA